MDPNSAGRRPENFGARTDANRGVWKAPAGLETVITNTRGVVGSGIVTDGRQGVLNPLGVNCLRAFPGVGTVIYGARTLVTANLALQQDRYVPVRRTTLFIELSLKLNLGWVVFEPNDVPLWNAIRNEVEAFMRDPRGWSKAHGGTAGFGA